MMEKEFVKYEQALALRELGFNEPCMAIYYSKDKSFSWHHHIDHTNDEPVLESGEFNISAPTFSQAYRWFREKYELFGEIIMIIPEEGSLDGCITYVASVSNIREYKKCPKITNEYFPTYEKAESACLDKLIELVKNEQSK